MPQKKCTCANRKGAACPKKCSEYKLVFLLDHNHKNLQENGYNPARWSFIKEDKLPPDTIITKMLGRLSKHKDDHVLAPASNKVILYSRSGNQVASKKLRV